MASTRKYGCSSPWVGFPAPIHLRRYAVLYLPTSNSVESALGVFRFYSLLPSSTMPVSCSSLPHPHSSNQSVSMESLPRISMTDRSVQNQENPIQSKTPVRYEWILLRPSSRTCLAPRRLLHLIDLLHACIVMDTVPQFGAVFLARRRQLAHLRSENRLCAVLAKPGEAASCWHWQNRTLLCKSQKAWRAQGSKTDGCACIGKDGRCLARAAAANSRFEKQ
ncbi:hypothetical protein CMEL01_03174 [Colletotrichum melonis]|uniref:Uncharacterized protein n=1 Tax=Colletotrichum melonis TaxID=1209925 RepID=A0AAI9UKI7_9PEZI|nr:hypothetical protein CMEL01_03174 [Colletotrichum melonis]